MHVPRETVIISGLAIAIGLGVVLFHVKGANEAAMPEGLIQVSGRIEGDRVSVSSKYAGRIARLLVREGDAVAAGQAMVQMDDAEARARLDQARAALRMAETDAEGAGESVALVRETGVSQIDQAENVLRQAESGVASSVADHSRSLAAVDAARATWRGYEAAVSTAKAAVAAAGADRQRANAAVSAAEADLTAARASARAAQAGVDAAAAALDRASSDVRRYRTLLDEQAISAQMFEQAVTAERTAAAQLSSSREQAASAESLAQARQSAVGAARSQVEAADAAVAQAKAQLSAAVEQSGAARSGIRQASAVSKAQQAVVQQAEGRRRQAAASLAQARTAPRQVAVSRAGHLTAGARVEQAKAAVREIETAVQDMVVRAPAAGIVAARMVDAGEVVGAGAPLLDLVDLDRLYLKVYVPEIQIGKLRLGLPARIYIDSLPDRHFDAEVRYIASAAEFTPKEVQTVDERVKLVYSVKLNVLSNPQHALSPGMPSDAIIRWKEQAPWKRPRW